MNPKFLFFAALVWICNQSFAQQAQANTIADTTIENVDTTTAKKCSKTCKKKTSNKNATVYNNREWRKIKKEMKRNRKMRGTASKNEYTIPTRVLDTIVLDTPRLTAQTQLSSW